MKRYFKAIKVKYLNSTTASDWFLMIFMIMLMAQTIYNLFFNEAMGNISNIDIAIRTTTSGLFGYYTGMGFMQNENESQDKFKNKLDEKEVDINDYSEKKSNKRNNMQIVIVGTLGIISLIMLIIVRNMDITTNQSVATLSQLRSFVSGSIGFLSSHSKK